MCVKIASGIHSKKRYAKLRGDSAEVERLDRELDVETLTIEKAHISTCFGGETDLEVYTNLEPKRMQTMKWGLIPMQSPSPGTVPWTSEQVNKFRKTEGHHVQSENMFNFDKWKYNSKYQRCLIYVDYYIEYHKEGDKKYPYRIAMKSGDPMIIAGLWNVWYDPNTALLHKTAAMVTVMPPADHIMHHIHNAPVKSKTPRMPIILTSDNQDEWLMPVNTYGDIKKLLTYARPIDSDLLEAAPLDKF